MKYTELERFIRDEIMASVGVKVFLKDIRTYANDVRRTIETGINSFSNSAETTLYKKHGTAYVRLVELAHYNHLGRDDERVSGFVGLQY